MFSRIDDYLDKLWDILYPKRCVRCASSGSWVCASCLASCVRVDSLTIGAVPNLTATYAVYAYTDTIRELVHEFKYRGVFSIGKWMAQQIAPLVSQDSYSVIVPVPMHRKRRRYRGYNQSEVIGRYLSNFTSIPMRGVLSRTRITSPQYMLNGEERWRNVQGAFVANVKLSGDLVLLVDDVLTTGATLSECAKVLLESGAKDVHGAVFARALLESSSADITR